MARRRRLQGRAWAASRASRPTGGTEAGPGVVAGTVVCRPGPTGQQAARRGLLAGAAGWLATVAVRPALAQGSGAADTQAELAAAVRAFAGGVPVQAGRVTLAVAPLVDNGNTVPVTVSVDSPMTAADHVQAIAIFSERNPQRDVARFTLTPRCGRARVETRIRLATSQQLVAVARLSDGTCWSHTVDVVVTLAACIES